MSSMATFGPPAALSGPRPERLPYGLFSVAQVIDDADTHWGAGGSIWPYPTGGGAHAWDPCGGDTKEEGEPTAMALFAAFGVYLPVTCTARGIGNDAEFRERAVAAFEAVEQTAVEREFMSGATIPTNPYPADGNGDDLGTGEPDEALALLEKAVGEAGYRQVIHASRDTASIWASSGALVQKGDQLQTWLGTPVVAGAGYNDASPDGAPGTGEGYAFLTGPVQIRRSATTVVPGSLAEALNRTDNTVTFLVERDYLVTWDAQVQASILVDRSL